MVAYYIEILIGANWTVLTDALNSKQAAIDIAFVVRNEFEPRVVDQDGKIVWTWE